MNLVQEYKDLIDRLYEKQLPRKSDEDLRHQLSDLWFQMSDRDQVNVQSYSLWVRQGRRGDLRTAR